MSNNDGLAGLRKLWTDEQRERMAKMGRGWLRWAFPERTQIEALKQARAEALAARWILPTRPVRVDYAAGPDWSTVQVWKKGEDGAWRQVPSVDFRKLEPVEQARLMVALFEAAPGWTRDDD